MRFNKHMIDLVREIRRRVPSHQKPSIKLANPELIDELNLAFEQSKDTICKLLIREFVEQNRELDEPLLDTSESIKPKVSVDSLESNKDSDKRGLTPNSTRPKRVYRGQVIEA